MKKMPAMVLCLIALVMMIPVYAETDLQSAKAGDMVTLGAYAGEAIGWQVLASEDGELLLIAQYGIEAVLYNTENTSVTWETCSLRAWLNGEFYENAFTEDEKKLIALTDVANADNAECGTDGGNDTRDYVYLLSLDEVNAYFGSDEERVCVATAHAVENGAYALSQEDVNNYGKDYAYPLTVGGAIWWLRSPGDCASRAAGVNSDGIVYGIGKDANCTGVCARPVVVVHLADDISR